MEEIISMGKKAFIESVALQKFSQYAIKAHADTNQWYDDYLPYEFHLRMVVKAGKDFLHLLPMELWENVVMALWSHDLIEDARENYNSVLKKSNEYVAEIARACTNYGRGRNRKERMPDFVYEDIKNTPGALFVKLADRIANVQYSLMTDSRMFSVYKGEHEHFTKMLYSVEAGLDPMWEYLNSLFQEK